ncbi:MAG: hypothetical protein U9N02_04365 [Campylobacterota bacterium]|nr:hypothetical protein [Campylobacterota bacterium]
MNLIFLVTAKDIKKYVRAMRLFNPISGTAIGVVLFTGVVMMAAKHLDFTIENIVMILFTIALMALEGKRASQLKWTNPKLENALENYKKFALKIFAIEVVLVLSVSAWMWTIN